MDLRSRSLLTYLALAFLSPPPLLGQRDSLVPAVWNGVVLDTVAGEPLRGAVIFLEPWGVARTDSSGHFRFRRPAPGGEIRIVLRCPITRRMAGRVLSIQYLHLDAVSDTVLTVLVDASGCAEPPETTVKATWRGHYIWGFEEGTFRSCGQLADLSYTAYGGVHYEAWVHVSADRLIDGWPEVPPPVDSRYYVQWSGELKGPGSYGHLGGSTFLLTVTEIIEIRNPGPNDCS